MKLLLYFCPAVILAQSITIPGPGQSHSASGPPPDITVSAFTQAAIQTAFNACTGVAGGTTIFFPAGTYVISSSILLPTHPCNLYGVRALSILDGSSCSCYIFSDPGGRFDGGTIQKLNFKGGGIFFDYFFGETITQNVFQLITTQYVLSALNGVTNLTLTNNILTNGTTVCNSPCGSANPTFIQTFSAVSNSTMTGNWIDGAYQGFSLGGSGSPGSNNVISNNTLLHLIRMGLEFTTQNSNLVVSHNYIAQWRTQDEHASPNGVTCPQAGVCTFNGQNPTVGCPNYPNGTGTGVNGGGNRYDCNSFAISIVGFGSNVSIDDNLLYGVINDINNACWGIEYVLASGEVKRNVSLNLAYNFFDDGQNSMNGNVSNNTSCFGFNPNPGTGPGNVFFASCFAGGVPAVQPVPNQPFNPITGL